VRVVATGFAVRPRELARGIATIESLGYAVRVGEHALERDGYLAGGDDARSEDLRAALADGEARAIWFARGGYGTARLLDRVSWKRLARAPKLLVGYSDLTALFAPAVEAGARCLYGPVVAELGRAGAWDRRSLCELLAGRPLRFRVRASDVVVPGRAAGTLVGGNLTVLTHLCGTPWAPRLDGRILFLEEVGEEAYRIDRMLTQLRSARVFHGLRGVLLGAFEVPRRRRFPPDRAWIASIRETFEPLGIPVIAGIPAGHLPAKRTLPLGGRALLDSVAREVRLAP
jgi:muramoyltetrapeptide carboxypeptidase